MITILRWIERQVVRLDMRLMTLIGKQEGWL